MWSKPLLRRFRQSKKTPQTQASQGFAAFRLALSRIAPRHSQSKRATNCATPRNYIIFCLLALLARPAVPEKILALSACSFFSTAARAPPRCIRRRRRSASHPKVQALPTALHPDIINYNTMLLLSARLPCSPGLRSTITPTVYWIFRRKSTAGAPFLPAAKSKGRDLLRSLSLREMFCGFTGGNYLASTSAMWPMRSSSLLL